MKRNLTSKCIHCYFAHLGFWKFHLLLFYEGFLCRKYNDIGRCVYNKELCPNFNCRGHGYSRTGNYYLICSKTLKGSIVSQELYFTVNA